MPRSKKLVALMMNAIIPTVSVRKFNGKKLMCEKGKGNHSGCEKFTATMYAKTIELKMKTVRNTTPKTRGAELMPIHSWECQVLSAFSILN
jgi:hypothetical protein